MQASPRARDERVGDLIQRVDNPKRFPTPSFVSLGNDECYLLVPLIPNLLLYWIIDIDKLNIQAVLFC